MTKTLLTIGECMVEMAPTTGGLFQMGYAGDTFNTAWYARKLAAPDTDIAFLSAIGSDEASAKLAAFVRDAGITPFLQVIDDATVGLYLISTKDGERSFSYWRSASAARRLAEDMSELPATPGDTVFFSGITMAVLQGDGRAHLLAAVAKARANGATVAFDPNLRPRLWKDADTMRHWITDAARHADIVLPSHEDEATWFDDASPEATADRYRALGCGLTIVKDGPGAVLIAPHGQAIEKVQPQLVAKPVDTTAAGDAFNAAFLTAFMNGQPTADCVKAGCALSAKVIQAPGALVDI